MHKKLSEKIKKNILLLSIIPLMLTMLLTFFISCAVLLSDHEKYASERLSRAVSRCAVYFDSVKNASETIAKDKALTQRAAGKNSEPMTEKLKSFCNLPQKLSGATLYTLSGEVLSSPGVARQAPLSSHLETAEFNEFFLSDSAGFFYMRTSLVAAIYNDKPYNEESGMITYVCKVYDADVLVGYLFSDVMPSNVYSRFLTLDSAVTFFGAPDGTYFPYGENTSASAANYFGLRQNGNPVTAGGLKAVVCSESFYGGTIAAAISLSPLRSVVLSVGLWLGAVIVLAITAIIVCASLMSKRLAKRLSRLQNRMKDGL